MKIKFSLSLLSVICLNFLLLNAHAKIDFSLEDCINYYNSKFLKLDLFTASHINAGTTVYELVYPDYLIHLVFHSKYENEIDVGDYCYEIRYYLKEKHRSINKIHKLIRDNLGEVELSKGSDIALKNPQLFRIVDSYETGEALFIDYQDDKLLDINPVTELNAPLDFKIINMDGLPTARTYPNRDLIKGFRYQLGDSDVNSNWVQCEFTSSFEILAIRDLERYKEIRDRDIPRRIESLIKNIEMSRNR